MENLNDYQDSFLSLMESQDTVYLSTIDTEGYPSTRAMLNLKNPTLYPHLTDLYEEEENPFIIYLSTNTSSMKMEEIVENNKTCLYYCDSPQFLGLTLKGEIEVITDKEFKRRAWAEGWEMYYEGGINSEDFTMLRFIPKDIKIYGGNLNVVTQKIK